MMYATLLMILAALCGPPDAALTALFTPARPRLGRYEACASALALDRLAAEYRRAGLHDSPAESLDPFDAFGAAGAYDRAALARLYTGQRVTVVRGWSRTGDGFESVTLISPYPDGSMTRLVPGTLVVRFIL